jgi:DNA-binding transcriptional MerR regulator
MTREQAINYLRSSGFSEKQIQEIVKALEQEHGDKQRYVVRGINNDKIEFIDKYSVRAFNRYIKFIKDSCKYEVLNKLRAEIVDLGQRTMNDNRASGIWACRDIIDDYKAESE